MRRFGVDIGGHDVRLHFVPAGADGRGRVVDRVQHREQFGRPVAVTESGNGKHGPDGGVRVLATVLADARQVALHIPRVDVGMVERRCEQQHHAVAAPDQQLVDRRHCLSGPCRIGGAGQHGPRLRDRIDPAFRVDRRAQRGAVVEEGAAVPAPVPTLALERLAEALHVGSPRLRARIAAGLGDRGEPRQGRVQEPSQPHTLAATFVADAVHPVVPVARPDERQPMRPDCQAPVQRCGTVFVHRHRLPPGLGLEIRVGLVRAEGRALQVRDGLVEQRRVTRDGKVAFEHVGQPHAVVRDAGPDAAAGWRMPPVLHVTFSELVRCRSEQLLTRKVGPRDQERHDVLQLIAEAIRTAGLVERRPGPEAAGERLVDQPAIQEDVHRSIGRPHLDRAEDLVPLAPDLGQRALRDRPPDRVR